MRILGIETSCDETGVAIYDSERGLLAHALHSQISVHAPFGGVVPELAARDHIQKLLPLLEASLTEANLALAEIDVIAYTAGPGLIGALLVGACFAKSLGFALKIPVIPIHHLEGHLLAALLENPALEFPFLGLLISGGHTLLIQVEALGQYQILGETLDDAVGEAFDKIAKLLGLDYPGGAALSKLAEQGDPARFHFPRPLTEKPGLDFSFSGLKTFTLNTLHKTEQTEKDKADIARAFETAVVDTLFIKCKRALQATKMTRLVVAGGVAANKPLRAKLSGLKEYLKVDIFYPKAEFCTDNGAMIAFTGFLRTKFSEHTINNKQFKIDVHARWPIDHAN